MRLFKILKALAQRPYIVSEEMIDDWFCRTWSNGWVEMDRHFYLSSVSAYQTLQTETNFKYWFYSDFNLPIHLTASKTTVAYHSGYFGTDGGLSIRDSLVGGSGIYNRVRIYSAGRVNNTSHEGFITVKGFMGGVAKTLINWAIGGVIYAFV